MIDKLEIARTIIEGCLLNGDVVDDYCQRDRISAIHVINDLIDEKQERDNPKPLTLAQLKQMEGEPVWVVDHIDDIIGWALIIWVDNGAGWVKVMYYEPRFGNCCRVINIHIDSVKAYAHKPKEE